MLRANYAQADLPRSALSGQPPPVVRPSARTKITEVSRKQTKAASGRSPAWKVPAAIGSLVPGAMPPGYSSLGQHAAWDALEFGRAHGISESAYSESSRQSVHFDRAFRRHQWMFILRHLGSAVRTTSWASQVYGPTVAYRHITIMLGGLWPCGGSQADHHAADHHFYRHTA